jgi:hypothetical protein
VAQKEAVATSYSIIEYMYVWTADAGGEKRGRYGLGSAYVGLSWISLESVGLERSTQDVVSTRGENEGVKAGQGR